jgi:alpha-beta hydrolase superfamily lysophospholipase
MARTAKRSSKYLLAAALGFVAGAIAVYVFLAPGGSSLSLWHTTVLTEEFSAADADEIQTFDDYVRLEDRLFAQLDEKIYARTASGPEYSLVRYSPGSAADPRRWERNWNRSFEFRSDSAVAGVLLLHGMSDSPYSLRALGESLVRRGYWVLGLRLPGHGTIPSGYTRVTIEDMHAAVRLAVTHLASEVGPRPIHLVGYSTGAPLAVNFTLAALEGDAGPTPASLVLISPAIGVTRAAGLARWKARLARLPGMEKFAWTQVLPEFDPFKYNSFAANAAYQVHRLTRSVAAEVERRAAAGSLEGFPPTLAFLSTVDATVSADAVIDNLLEHLPGARHELVLFDINRIDVASSVLVSDPGPLTARLLAADTLPFALTLIANESPGSMDVASRRKPPLSNDIISEPLGVSWPVGTISLSHIAMPFRPDDPLYGRTRPPGSDIVFLGERAIQGERGLLKFPVDWLLRLRHNPFYDYLESRIFEWVAPSGDPRSPASDS